MDEFWNNIRNPSWITSVVIVGIILNLVSSYLKSYLDRGINLISVKRKFATIENNRKLQLQIREIISAPSKIIELKLDIVIHSIKSIMYFLVCIIVEVFTDNTRDRYLFTVPMPGNWTLGISFLFVSFILQIILLVLAMVSVMRATEKDRLLGEVEKVSRQEKK